MIRRSLAIALGAALLSLLLHILGITSTVRIAEDETAASQQTDVVELTTAFEDLAEAASEAVEPEDTPRPEPVTAPAPIPEQAEPPPEPEEAEAPPEPEEAEPPTSQALVASANPQQTFAPDTGVVETGQRSTIGENGTEEPGAPDPNTVQPVEGEPGAPSQPDSAPPVTPERAEAPPQGVTDGAQDATDQDLADANDDRGEEETSEAQDAASERLAALAAPTAPNASVTLPVAPSAVPVIALNPDDALSESVETPPETAAENTETTPDALAEEDAATAAVTSSPRPRLRQAARNAQPIGAPDSPQTLRDYLRDPNRVIESPLTAYRRDGVDPFLRGGGGNRGGNGFQSASGPGNSDVTNYNGRVLVHLNRSRRIAVSERGWARVFFRINPDGSLAWVDVLDGSGSAEVDRGAKAQVRAAAPFPRPPNGGTRQLTFVYQNR
ncbi:MAG: TonB family protein [Pseudomonadota bacterium]